MKVVKLEILPDTKMDWSVYDDGIVIAVGNHDCMYTLLDDKLSDEAKTVLNGYQVTPPRVGTVTFVKHDATPYYVSDR